MRKLKLCVVSVCNERKNSEKKISKKNFQKVFSSKLNCIINLKKKKTASHGTRCNVRLERSTAWK